MTNQTKMISKNFNVSFRKHFSCDIHPPSEEQLSNMKRATQTLLQEYNSTPYIEMEKRKNILNFIFKDDVKVKINSPFTCNYGTNIKIGKKAHVNYNLTINDDYNVELGENALIAPNVTFLTSFNHPKSKDMHIKDVKEGPIKIGKNVWICGSAVIGPGVTIGENSVIGSGAVVFDDIPPNSIAVGNPAHVVKKLENNIE